MEKCVCELCDYEWYPRVPDPKVCPRCKAYRGNWCPQKHIKKKGGEGVQDETVQNPEEINELDWMKIHRCKTKIIAKQSAKEKV